jgi:hypothetical protein
MIEVLKKEKLAKIKFSVDVEIDLVGGKLPSVQMIAKASKKIASKYPEFETYFMCFYLPGMRLDLGAFATAHHNPKLKVNIQDFVLIDKYPEYSKLLEE